MFIGHLLARAIRVEADLVDQLFNSSEKRLARMLLLLANFGKDEKPEPILPKISQETLADMIRTTRSRVSFFMNKFRKLGFIDYNGGIEVHRIRTTIDGVRWGIRPVGLPFVGVKGAALQVDGRPACVSSANGVPPSRGGISLLRSRATLRLTPQPSARGSKPP